MYRKWKPGQTAKDRYERITQDAEKKKSERIKHEFNCKKQWA